MYNYFFEAVWWSRLLVKSNPNKGQFNSANGLVDVFSNIMQIFVLLSIGGRFKHQNTVRVVLLGCATD